MISLICTGAPFGMIERLVSRLSLPNPSKRTPGPHQENANSGQIARRAAGAAPLYMPIRIFRGRVVGERASTIGISPVSPAATMAACSRTCWRRAQSPRVAEVHAVRIWSREGIGPSFTSHLRRQLIILEVLR